MFTRAERIARVLACPKKKTKAIKRELKHYWRFVGSAECYVGDEELWVCRRCGCRSLSNGYPRDPKNSLYPPCISPEWLAKWRKAGKNKDRMEQNARKKYT